VQEELKPANNWFHVPFQIVVASVCLYWYRRPPVPNKAVLVLTVVTVVMALFGMRTSHKAVYLLLVFCLMFTENRAINRDRTDAEAAESGRRAAENAQFQTIADGIDATMQRAGLILESTKQVGTVVASLERDAKLARLEEGAGQERGLKVRALELAQMIAEFYNSRAEVRPLPGMPSLEQERTMGTDAAFAFRNAPTMQFDSETVSRYGNTYWPQVMEIVSELKKKNVFSGNECDSVPVVRNPGQASYILSCVLEIQEAANKLP
jgi:hypothetical protein